MNAGHTAEGAVRQFFREHVLTPLTEAEKDVEAERSEVDAERRAFLRFTDRIAGIEPETPSRSPPKTRTWQARPCGQNRSGERARAAFLETVMSVDHYEEVYDETLEEHATAELSADIAAGLRRDGATPFTEWYKRTLTAAVERAITQRERFIGQLEDETASLDTSHTALAELVDACDGPRVPAWYRADLEDQLDDIAQDRQDVIQQRSPLSRTDGHDLCAYLYRDREWTYPVLTAVTRFRNVV